MNKEHPEPRGDEPRGSAPSGGEKSGERSCDPWDPWKNALGSEPVPSDIDLVPTEGEEVPFFVPERIGKYNIRNVIDSTSFKDVYLAHHPDLNIDVVVKLSRPGVGLVLQEARILAGLDGHPGVVKVFDAGVNDEGRAFLVEQLIPGSDLSRVIAENRPSHRASAKLIENVASALHHVHLGGVFHRDIKPANILLTEDGKPYVTDFGLALRVEDFGDKDRQGGTFLYMSPEQARNEGHLVDNRTDIYSLGLVLYELLTGERAVQGTNVHQVLEQIKTQEPRRPREIDGSIAPELERVFLKATAKRRSDRYRTAAQLAADLESYLDSGVEASGARKQAAVVPKGLRAYDGADSEFFLQLVPGPRDRHGLPESLRFWKNRIVERDAEQTFRVGLLYGPSGCGKSSFVKAGLLPLLPDDIACVQVDATAKHTESWLLRRLHRKLPRLNRQLTLVQTLSLIREGGSGAVGKKVLIVLDQFEQRLQAELSVETTELIQALRHCDGDHLQCLILVRDDFWMPITRFFHELEIPIDAGVNSAASDLFDRRHARKVLEVIGRAYGALPESSKALEPAHERFLDTAVEALLESGNVIPVRLALFAQMIQDRDWNDRTLKALGGARGVGVAFLEQSFESTRAKADCARHQRAAMGALNALLPQEGQNIKGALRSREELREAAGYQRSPKAFEELVGILDGRLRLMTPVHPEPPDGEPEDGHSSEAPRGEYFQLTHDYLVPSLRDWLTRKQRETARGRAQLRLVQRTALWDSRRERKQLPSLFEWINITLFTGRTQRSQPEREMLRQAMRYHASRTTAIAAAIVLAALLFFTWRERIRMDGYLTSLRLTPWNRLAELIQEKIEPNVDSLEPRLRDELHETEDAGERTRIRLALLPADQGQIEPLKADMLEARPEVLMVIRQALEPYVGEPFLDALWGELEGHSSADRGYHAAGALAAYDAGDSRWSEYAGFVTAQIVTEEPLGLERWIEVFQPIRSHLRDPLRRVSKKAGFESRNATTALVVYREGDAELLQLLHGASAEQFGIVVAFLRTAGAELLQEALSQPVPQNVPPGEAEELAGSFSNLVLAALMLHSRGEQYWQYFRAHSRPFHRTFLIHRALPYGLDPARVFKRLQQSQDVSERRALVLALGSYNPELLLTPARERMSKKFVEWYKSEPDPGLHSAIRWLLVRWGLASRVRAVGESFANQPRGKRNWFVTKQGFTMAILPAPSEFHPDEKAWSTNLTRSYGPSPTHSMTMGGYRLAVSTTEITRRQYALFPAARQPAGDPPDSSPATSLTHDDMAEYCEWLSRHEDLESCYLRTPDGWELRPDFLKRSGYRLPTYTEWEYACRAGTDSERYFASESLAAEYEWFSDNSHQKVRPVGRLKPNDFGLFDVLGNVTELCECCFEETCIDQRRRGAHILFHRKFVSYYSGLQVKPSFHSKETGFRVVRIIRGS